MAANAIIRITQLLGEENARDVFDGTFGTGEVYGVSDDVLVYMLHVIPTVRMW